MSKFFSGIKGFFSKNSKVLKKVGIIAGAILGVAAVIYFGLALFFTSHFYFRSTLNGVKAGGADAKKVSNAILAKADGYDKITVIDEDKDKIVIPMEDIDMTVCVNNNEVESVLEKQNGFLWVKYLFKPKNYVNYDIINVDTDKLSDKLSGLTCIGRKTSTPTVDAKCVYKNDEFVIEKEIYGDSITLEDLTKKVDNYICVFNDTFDVIEDEGYEQPKITADSKKLIKLCKKLNKIADVTITYEIGDKNEVVPKENIVSWMSSDSKGNISWDDEAIAEYVKSMAHKYDTYGQPKQLKTTWGETVTVPGGSYGWKIDREAEAAQLREDLENARDVNRDFVYSSTANSRGENDYGDSYVEINLTAQHLYLYKDGKKILESDFVSGNPFKGNGTPAGAYSVMYKEKDATLRGDNYATPVSFWMPFAGNVGMHDATWRSHFGGQIYRTNGSHGCVNLPKSVAQSIFENIDKGYAVLVYNLGGTESIDFEVEAAKAVVNQINAIGPVTLESEPAIAAARAAYEALPGEAKQGVSNLDVLVNAENALAGLKESAAAQAAADEAAARNKSAADGVAQRIDKAISSNNEGDITDAYEAYNALSKEQKELVDSKKVSKIKSLYEGLSETSE